jgi:hypothetical protein
MLERLKYKCMVLVSSLLELNSDPNAIKRILRSLPLNVLKKNLIFIYKKHQKMYKKLGYNKESLGHVIIHYIKARRKSTHINQTL